MTNPTSTPTVRKLGGVFLRIGNTTFGGGYVTMGMLGRELVDTRHWITRDKFDLSFALARVTPGTNVLAFCAAVGASICGFTGAVVAVIAASAPSAAIAVMVLQGFESFQSNPIAAAAIGATVAAVAGMMWATIWTILRPYVGGLTRSGMIRNLQMILITGGAFLASWKYHVTPVPIIFAGALIGFLWKDGQES